MKHTNAGQSQRQFSVDFFGILNAKVYALPSPERTRKMIQIGARLKEERLALGLSQPQLAAVGLVKPNAQSHYESGKRIPKSDYLIEIGKVGIDLLYVITGKRYQSTLDGLATVEQKVIQLYRLLSVADQQIVARIASNLERSVLAEKFDPD